MNFQRTTLASGWGVHELDLAPPRKDGRVLILAADEIQPQKFPDMQTHVSTWTIQPAGGRRLQPKSVATRRTGASAGAQSTED